MMGLPIAAARGFFAMVNTTTLYVYLGIFVALVAAGLGFPIPEEIPVVTAGALVGHAAEPPQLPAEYPAVLAVAPQAPFPANVPWAALILANQHEESKPIPLRWWLMLPLCILGVVLSDGLLYGIGRFSGPRLLEKPGMVRLLPPPRRRQIEDNFHKYGVFVLLFARFLPAIRSPIFIMAGIMRLPFTRFLLADGLYAIPGVSLLFFLAFWFGDQFREIIVRAEGRVEKLKPLLVLLGITAVASWLLYHFLRKPVATGNPAELPLIGDKVAAQIEGPHPSAPVADCPPKPPDGQLPRSNGPNGAGNPFGERGP
jgi:membrane protein DedA with SNARE-associated domain